jgi:hypothetical protein
LRGAIVLAEIGAVLLAALLAAMGTLNFGKKTTTPPHYDRFTSRHRRNDIDNI